MNLDKHALGRMNLRGRDWKDLISAFEALGSDQDLRDFATMGATWSRSQDGSNYTVTSADTVVVFSLFYVARA